MSSGIKFTDLGDAKLTIIVPYRFREQVLELVRGHAMILDVDIDKWEGTDATSITLEKVHGDSGRPAKS